MTIIMQSKVRYEYHHPPSLTAAAHADSMQGPPRHWSHSRDLSWWTRMGLVVCPHASNHSRDKTGIPQMWLTQAEAPHAKEIPLFTQWIPLIDYKWTESDSAFVCHLLQLCIYTVPAVISIIISLYRSLIRNSPLIAIKLKHASVLHIYYSKRV